MNGEFYWKLEEKEKNMRINTKKDAKKLYDYIKDNDIELVYCCPNWDATSTFKFMSRNNLMGLKLTSPKHDDTLRTISPPDYVVDIFYHDRKLINTLIKDWK